MLSLKNFLHIVGTIFCIIGTLHFLRLFTHWQIVILGWVVPIWLSAVGAIAAWYLAYIAFAYARELRKERR